MEPSPAPHPQPAIGPGFFLLLLAAVAGIVGLNQDRAPFLQLGLLILTGFLVLSWALVYTGRR